MARCLGKFQQRLIKEMKPAYDDDGYTYTTRILNEITGASQQQINKALNSLIKKGLIKKSVNTEVGFNPNEWSYDYLLVENEQAHNEILMAKKAKRAKEEKLALELGYESRTDWAFATMFT